MEATWVRGELNQLLTEAIYEIVNEKMQDIEVVLYFATYDMPNDHSSIERYRREVLHVEPFLARLLDELQVRGVYDDTIIILTSDHGEGLGEHGVLQHAKNLFDEQIHVPLVIKPVRNDKAELARMRELSGEIISHMDVVPTVLTLAGLPPLPGQRGRSILIGARGVHIAQGYEPYADGDQICIRDERYKMIYNDQSKAFSMYDLKSDPDEVKDSYGTLNSERPGWSELLKKGLKAEKWGGRNVDPAMEEELKAIGYLGD